MNLGTKGKLRVRAYAGVLSKGKSSSVKQRVGTLQVNL